MKNENEISIQKNEYYLIFDVDDTLTKPKTVRKFLKS